MSYKVETTANFEKEEKRLIKKYPSLKSELTDLIEELSVNPFMGKFIMENIYKIRLSIESKGKGKRGGGRVLPYVKIIDETVYLFSIYSKGEKNDIDTRTIQNLIKKIL